MKYKGIAVKKILMLGGSYFQVPAIKFAKSQGHYVITCDYLPDNPGHKYADEYYNVSTTDKDAVLKLAEKLIIDGIVSYASDPAAPTQAYVAEKLGLPGNPFSTVNILCNKDEYRSFLRKHNFNTPRSDGFNCFNKAFEALDQFSFPVLIKPVDSSGSRGITLLNDKHDFSAAYDHALSYSRNKRIIIEEYVPMKGFQICGDGFVDKGELVFRCFGDEHFDYSCNGLVPIGPTFPCSATKEEEDKVHRETQRLLSLLSYKTGAINFDVRVTATGDVFLMEIGPRNGGNKTPEMIYMQTGVDLIQYTINSALGIDCSALQMTEQKGFTSGFIIHSLQEGTFKKVNYSEEINKIIIYKELWCKKGDKVRRFQGSNDTLGVVIMKNETKEKMIHYMENMNSHICVEVE